MGIGDLKFKFKLSEENTVKVIEEREQLIIELILERFKKINDERVIANDGRRANLDYATIQAEQQNQIEYYLVYIKADLFKTYQYAVEKDDKDTYRYFFVSGYFENNIDNSISKVFNNQKSLDMYYNKPRYREQFDAASETLQKLEQIYQKHFVSFQRRLK